jgi:alpha-D-ribose 1-methylphosphonate 5-triphosphate synthase subunit PhnI
VEEVAKVEELPSMTNGYGLVFEMENSEEMRLCATASQAQNRF